MPRRWNYQNNSSWKFFYSRNFYVAGFLALVVLAGFFFFLWGDKFSSATSYNWAQTLVSGGASTTAIATAGTNQNYYYGKDNSITVFRSATTTPNIAWWKLDGNTNDSAGANNGTASGTAASAQSIFGQSYYFDGNDDFIDVPDSDSLNLNSDFTISTWVKKAENNRQEIILDKGLYTLGFYPDGRAFFNVSADTGTSTNFSYFPGYPTAGAFAVHNKILYLALQNGDIYKYLGGSEQKMFIKKIPNCGQFCILSIVSYNGRLYFANERGKIYVYDDVNDSWRVINTVGTIGTWAMTVWNNELYLGAAESNGRYLYKYKDENTWERLYITPDGSNLNSLMVFNGNLYVGGGDNGKIWRYDEGAGFTEVGNTPGDWPNAMAEYKGYFYASTYYGSGDTYRWDGDTTWTSIGMPAGGTGTHSLVSWAGNFYASDYSGGLSRYDGGTTWTKIGTIQGNRAAVYKGRLYSGKSSIYSYGEGVGLFSESKFDDNWNQITISYSSASSLLSLSVNGQLEATTTVDFTLATSSNKLFIGKGYGTMESNNGSAGETNFKGWMDEVKIYGSALSASDVLRAYQREKYGLNGNMNFGIYENATSSSITETSDTDFLQGATSSVSLLGSGDDAYLTLKYDGSQDGSSYNFNGGATTTIIYRSVGVGGENEIASGTASKLLTIDASGNLTFSGATMPNRAGAGDAIVYDSNDSNTLTAADNVVFIHGRISNTAYTVKTETGTNTAVTTSDNDTWAVYRAYTSLANAEASTNNTSILPSFDAWSGGKDLTASSGANQIWNIACYGDAADAAEVTVGGWTTGPQNYVRIYTPYLPSEVGASQRHKGRWDTGKYSLEPSGGGSTLVVSQDHTRIEGLQVKTSSAITGSMTAIRIFRVRGIYVYDNIAAEGNIRATTTIRYGIQNILREHPVYPNYIFNNAAYNFTGLGFQNSNDGSNPAVNGRAYLYNNTAFNNKYYGFGFLNSGDSGIEVVAKNNLSYDNVNDYCGNPYSATSTNNAYLRSGGGIGSSPLNLSTACSGSLCASSTIFINAGGRDLRLKKTAAAANAGVNLAADPDLAFATDLNFDNRPYGASWDIGADEYGGYAATGTYVSKIYDSGVDGANYGIISWSEEQYSEASTTIYIKVRTSNDPGMSGASAWSNCQSSVSGLDISNNNCVQDGQRYFQYQASLQTSDAAYTPKLYNLTINYSYYPASAKEFFSSPFDTADSGAYLSGLSWKEEIATSTKITAYLRTGADSSSLFSSAWIPIASSSPTFITSGCSRTTAANGSAWENSVACASTTIPAQFRDSVSDRFFQYKYSLTGSGVFAPSAGDFQLAYAINSPPNFNPALGAEGAAAFQIATSSDPNQGQVKINFSIRDIDAQSGNITPGYLTPSFAYSLNNGASWADISSSSLLVSAVTASGTIADINIDGADDIKAGENGYIEYQAYWDVSAISSSSNNTKIRITVSDNETANYFAIASTSLFALDVDAPSVPANLAATAISTSQINLTWDASSDNVAVAGYRIYRDGPQIAATSSTNYSNLGLAAGTTYQYSVRAYDAVGNISSASAVVPAITLSPSSGSGSSGRRNYPPKIPAGGFKIEINNGATSTVDRIVDLAFNAGADARKMAISSKEDLSDTNLEDYSASYEFDLCSSYGGTIKRLNCPAGAYQIYARFYTDRGLASLPVSDSIVLRGKTIEPERNSEENKTGGSGDSPNSSSGTSTKEQVLEKEKPATSSEEKIIKIKKEVKAKIAELFKKYLRFGQKNSDVRRLQIFLNQDPRTRVAESGAGSPGSETLFFGPRTLRAVIKFQEKYLEEVLAPWKLARGTGFVGQTTLTKINRILSGVLK